MQPSPATLFDDGEVDMDLSRCPAEYLDVFLDIVVFDRFLAYVYGVLLRRAPDRQGLAHYRERARQGLSRPAIVQHLLKSAEHRASTGENRGLAPETFVNRAYQDILGRCPDQAGLEAYARLAARRGGRRRVIGQLAGSAEARSLRHTSRWNRIQALRAYARHRFLRDLPVIGSWLERGRKRRERIDKIAANQRLLADQLQRLRRDMEAASLGEGEPFGFLGQGSGNETEQAIFRQALRHYRHKL